MSLESNDFVPTPQHFEPIERLNAKWVAIIPFAFGDSGRTEVRYNFQYQWEGERRNGIIKSIQLAQKQGFKVMLKPQLWIDKQFVGHIDFGKNESKWQEFERNLSTFILDYAHIADSMNVALFSVGCEFKKSVVKRKQFWFSLIKKVRRLYKGPLTYSSNWDNFHLVPFWKQLDVIGIDAYFPMSNRVTPSLRELRFKWKEISTVLEKLSRLYNKKILFTEYGFRSVDYNLKETWASEKPGKVNQKAQQIAYEAMFNSVWKEKWFLGGFLWKWKFDHIKAGGSNDNRYTPQNKLAEKSIQTYFRTYNSLVDGN